jgi:hypothetical protein
MNSAAHEIANSARELTRTIERGVDVTLPLAVDWASSISAARLESDAHRLGFMYGHGARLLDREADAWIEAVVRSKGDQHVRFAAQAILGVVASELIDDEDLEKVWTRRGSIDPWWRVYVTDLSVDRAVPLTIDGT